MQIHLCMLTVVAVLLPSGLCGQTRSMAQDSTLNNLQHPPGVETVPFGTLGHLQRVGEGPRTLLLIPGLGFGDDIWTEFMERHRTEYTMYAITLPGFGGTLPLSLPSDESKFGDAAWTRSTIQAIENLLDHEKIEHVTVVAHWILATQIALQLALDHPDRIDAVVLIGGVLRSYYENYPSMLTWTLDQRIQNTERLGTRWFRTVTRQTWDDNNFMSYDYAINPRRGLFLWREAQSPLLSVWIRYLLEFYCIDLTASLKDLRVPTLVAQPGFDDLDFYVEPNLNYMRNLCLDSWRAVKDTTSMLKFATISQSRLFIMHDQPDGLDRTIREFFSEVEEHQ